MKIQGKAVTIPSAARQVTDLVGLVIGMPQRKIGRHHIAHPLLEFLELRESTLDLARPDKRAIDRHVEHAAGAGDERHPTQLILERHEQFLRRPPGPHEPAALRAIGDGDDGFACQKTLVSVTGAGTALLVSPCG